MPATHSRFAVDSLLLQDASSQAAAISRQAISQEALLQKQLQAIQDLNPAINAYVQRVTPTAPVSGNSVLAGSSFAVKDNIDVAGLPSHAGLRALAAQPALADASSVARLKQAGMVFLGKLNMHAMALGASNHNLDFGNCYNPHCLSHTPGGSSGGSGAAVAAGLCAISLGTDTMGSVRIPAAYCGIVGFKASYDAIAVDGLVPLCRLLDHIGILARSVQDVIAAFGLLARAPGLALGSHSSAAPPLHFVVPADLSAMGATPEVCKAFEAGLQQLRPAGFTFHTVDMSDRPFSAIRRAGLLLCEAELNHTLASTLASRAEQIPADLLAMLQYGRNRSALDLSTALSAVVSAGQWLTASTAGFDGMLLPTAPQSAFAMDASAPHNQADFTAPANMNGAPAISIPLPVAEHAMPIGLQLIGHRGQDQALLMAALRAQQALN